MISVSNDFKDAIKASNRELYGYVELNYQNNEYDLEVTTKPQLADMVYNDGSGLVANDKIMTKYATLENNYTLLDGSFMVWNENRIVSGMVTDDVFEDIYDPIITIKNNSTTTPIKGITIYFKDNLPFDFYFTTEYTDGTSLIEQITDNTSMVYQKIFTNDVYISEISIVVNSVEHPDNRLRIACVDFNVSDLYEGEELVSFNVNEEIDLLLENIPINTCSIRLNNYPTQNGGNKFDPINPVGIAKYLTNNTTIEPYVGVLTKNNGIQYVKLGKFYISDWSSNYDGNVTIEGKSIMDKIKMEKLHSNGNFCYNNNSYWSGLSLTNYLNANTNYDFDLSFRNDIISNEMLKHMEIMDYLRVITLCNQNINTNSIFKSDRYDKIIINDINDTTVDSISKNELLNDVEYIINNPIKILNFTAMKNENNTSSQTKDVLNLNYSLTSEDEYVWIPIDNYLINYSPSFQKTFTYTTTGNGTATFVDCNDRMVYIHFVGNVNETFTLHLTTYVFPIDGNITTTINNSNSGETISIDVSDYFRINNGNQRIDICRGIINTCKKYTITASTIGDPSLETGDTINIQTRYTNNNNNGYKRMLITKQSFTYDGGLTCELEGVGD